LHKKNCDIFRYSKIYRKVRANKKRLAKLYRRRYRKTISTTSKENILCINTYISRHIYIHVSINDATINKDVLCRITGSQKAWVLECANNKISTIEKHTLSIMMFYTQWYTNNRKTQRVVVFVPDIILNEKLHILWSIQLLKPLSNLCTFITVHTKIK